MKQSPRWIERELFSLYTRYMREEIRKAKLEITQEQVLGAPKRTPKVYDQPVILGDNHSTAA